MRLYLFQLPGDSYGGYTSICHNTFHFPGFQVFDPDLHGRAAVLYECSRFMLEDEFDFFIGKGFFPGCFVGLLLCKLVDYGHLAARKGGIYQNSSEFSLGGINCRR